MVMTTAGHFLPSSQREESEDTATPSAFSVPSPRPREKNHVPFKQKARRINNHVVLQRVAPQLDRTQETRREWTTSTLFNWSTNIFEENGVFRR